LQQEDGYEFCNLPETTRNRRGAFSQRRNKGVARATESGKRERRATEEKIK
jgi:hypothetical protein